ncbi:MAG: hypothetical protein VB029_07080 [Anaerolineaceae bacterium]|nr:hypothetical protein [Anaerolineaceae bacterium]
MEKITWLGKGPWHEDNESELIDWTVQPPYEGLVTGAYYHADLRYSGRWGDSGHLGELDVATDDDGKILFAEFNETTMGNYYVRHFQNVSKRRTEFQFFQDFHDKRRSVAYGKVLANGFKHVEDQILDTQNLNGTFDLLTGASFSMKSMIGLTKDIYHQMNSPSKGAQRYYGYVEDFGYGLTGWLQVVVDAGRIVKCFYDEIFADHTDEIVYDDLKQFYRQSKYFSTTYEDPFPSGWDRHAWLVCFKDLSDLLNKKVCETQDLFDIAGLPCVEGPDMGIVWDKPSKDDIDLISNSDATKRSVTRPRSPVWNNYMRMAKVVQEAITLDKVTKAEEA